MTRTDSWRGAGTALVTPMTASLELDLTTYCALVRRQLEGGIRFLVIGGTTGEGAMLSRGEKRELTQVAAELAGSRARVIAGIAANDPDAAVVAAREAADAGAHAVLALVPAYLKPPQDALVEYFERIADESGLPVVLYNVPGRTGSDLGVEATLRLAEHPSIVAIKDASRDLDRTTELCALRPAGFEVWSGEDAWTLPMLALGATGVVSVVGNEAPDELARLVRAALRGNFREARRLHERLLPLMRANFIESNPIPVKAALSLMGFGGDDLRPPLRPLATERRAELRIALERAGLVATSPAPGLLEGAAR